MNAKKKFIASSVRSVDVREGKKLPGRYKGTRKRQAAPILVQIECPGCGWKGHVAKLEPAEMEYVLHLTDIHHGPLECVFCGQDVSRAIRMLADFGTLASHVRHYHLDQLQQIAKARGYEVEPGSIPAHAFKLNEQDLHATVETMRGKMPSAQVSKAHEKIHHLF